MRLHACGWGALAAATMVAGLIPARTVDAQEANDDRPNIVLVYTDDLDKTTTRRLVGLRRRMGHQGTVFTSAFVSYSLCCPSRATMLRGQYTHNHGIRSNSRGAPQFRARGLDESTVATWLQHAGYRTAYIGKYMNGYNSAYIPPGWDRWFVRVGLYHGFRMNDDGRIRRFDRKRVHDTDIYAAQSRNFSSALYLEEAQETIRTTSERRPFFMVVATDAPHQPAIPPARHLRRFRRAQLPSPPSFNERDVSDKPRWVRRSPRLTSRQITRMRRLHRGRLASMLGVSDLLRELIESLRRQGELGHTYIFFTSDNGYHLGQHRQTQGKRTPYEEDIGVPLMARGPRVPAGGTRGHLVLNNDLAPTFADIAGIPVPGFVDGRSLQALLEPNPPPTTRWRQRILIEHWRTKAVGGRTHIPNYRGVRGKRYVYIAYDTTGEKELYDLRKDPWQQHSLNTRRGRNRRLARRIHARLRVLRTCRAVGCRRTESR